MTEEEGSHTNSDPLLLYFDYVDQFFFYWICDFLVSGTHYDRLFGQQVLLQPSRSASHLTGEHVHSCLELMLFFSQKWNRVEKSQCSHYTLYQLNSSGDVNKNEKHKSNLDIQVATALLSHAAQEGSNKKAKFCLRPQDLLKLRKSTLPNPSVTFAIQRSFLIQLHKTDVVH